MNDEQHGGRQVVKKTKHYRTVHKRDSTRGEKINAVANHLRQTAEKQHCTSQEKKSCKTLTKNRLTMKVGLYNFGKTSETITRVVSEETAARANEDLKRILQLANNSPITTSRMVNEVDEVKENITVNQRAFIHQPSCSDNTSWPASTSPVNKRRRPTKGNGCKGKSSSRPSTPSSVRSEGLAVEPFPSSPPVEEIAARLSVVLDRKTQSLFPGRDYLQEKKLELQALLADNKGIPLFLPPPVTQETVVEAVNELCLAIPNDFPMGNDHDSMNGLKFLGLVEERNQISSQSSVLRVAHSQPVNLEGDDLHSYVGIVRQMVPAPPMDCFVNGSTSWQVPVGHCSRTEALLRHSAMPQEQRLHQESQVFTSPGNNCCSYCRQSRAMPMVLEDRHCPLSTTYTAVNADEMADIIQIRSLAESSSSSQCSSQQNLDFAPYIDQVERQRFSHSDGRGRTIGESSSDSDPVPAWHTLLESPTRPPLLISQSPTPHKFYRHKMY